MQDLRGVFRIDPTPTLGSPVFTLDYRAQARRPPWWRRFRFALWQWIRLR